MGNKSDEIHGMKSEVQARRKTILEHSEISEKDKEFCISKNQCWMDNLEEKSLSKQRDYLGKFKQMACYHDFNLSELNQNQDNILKIIKSINKSAYAVRVDEYSPETKKTFKQTLKRLIEYQSFQGDKYEHPEQAKNDLLPYDFTSNVKESDKKRTDPEDLPTPSDVKELCQSIEGISHSYTGARNVALQLFLWDAGCRIGEALSTDMKHVTIKDDRIEVVIQGNKKSDNRKITVKIATPSLKHYIENVHPCPRKQDAPLFINLNQNNERMSSSTFTNIVNRAKKKSSIDKDWSNQKNHIFRKGRITYLNKAEKMSESNIDIRVGHVVGSDTTRDYVRIGDKEADNSYLESYGLDSKDNSVEDDLEPLKCSDCQNINSGHRDSCRSCGSVLEVKAYPVEVDSNSKTENRIQEIQEELNKLK